MSWPVEDVVGGALLDHLTAVEDEDPLTQSLNCVSGSSSSTAVRWSSKAPPTTSSTGQDIRTPRPCLPRYRTSAEPRNCSPSRANHQTPGKRPPAAYSFPD